MSILIKVHFSIGYSDYSGKVADKLAAYEDTGLTPEEIKEDTPNIQKIEQELASYREAEERGELVRVVRCKDCMHKGWIQEPEHGKSVDYCRLLDRCADKQFFCAAGERNCGAMMDGEAADAADRD